MKSDLSRGAWFKSSYSNGQGGSCVEVCTNLPGIVGIRDTKNPGPEMAVSDQAFTALVEGIKRGEFAL
jgi:hypothetical protein